MLGSVRPRPAFNRIHISQSPVAGFRVPCFRRSFEVRGGCEMRRSIDGRALRATGLLFLFSLPVGAWAAADTVLVRNDGTRSVVSVADRGGVARVLRETTATVRPGRLGADPAGSVRFADWDEDGVRFFALSRDQGETWSEAQSVPTELMLLDGAAGRGQPLPAPLPGLAQAEDGRLFLVQFRTLSLPEW